MYSVVYNAAAGLSSAVTAQALEGQTSSKMMHAAAQQAAGAKHGGLYSTASLVVNKPS